MERENGELAQLVERVLSMHEVAGSIPAFSTRFLLGELVLLPFFVREHFLGDFYPAMVLLGLPRVTTTGAKTIITREKIS
jgi:hypothetical protein